MTTTTRPQTPGPLILATIALALLLSACGGGGVAVAPTAPTAAPAGLALQREAAPVTDSSGEAPPPAAEPIPPAAMPTAAPEPTMLPAEAVAGADAARESVAGSTGFTPPPPPRPDERQTTPLKAGEVDDNADFAAYQAYLRSYRGGGVLPADVSERYIITVVNERQQPVLDARVRLFDGETQVFEGRTYAGGRTIAFPRALGVSDQSASLRVLIEKGNSSAEGALTRGQDERQSFTLGGAQALPEQPRLDVLFLLDATGSMGDEIAQIQETIGSIAARIDQIEPRPALRFGLVAYRDRGDAYVTELYSNFTPDVREFQAALMQVSAQGGGDTPEDLNAGLSVSVQQMAWREDAVRLIFLVADAPAHLDYPQQTDYLQSARAAVAQGVKIYPIGASNTDAAAEYQFRQLAQQTLASFIFLTYQPGQNSGAPGDTTQMNVDPEAFTVERLDDLVVQVVQRELALALGAS